MQKLSGASWICPLDQIIHQTSASTTNMDTRGHRAIRAEFIGREEAQNSQKLEESG